jgi:periplasmic protein TonB
MSNETRQAVAVAQGADFFDTANDRFKRSFGAWFWGSMVAATLMHMAIMAFFPNLSASDVSFAMDEFEAIELPPEIEVPPPPEQIQRPANPVISEAMIDEDITIAPTTFEDNQPDDLPPPRADAGAGLGDAPTFTPFTVAPEVRNRPAVARALEREYPPLLRDAGVGGTVLMYFFIDENGRVQDHRVHESSGHVSLDQAAMRVAEVFEFSAAMNRDQRVPVWIQIPITFTTR